MFIGCRLFAYDPGSLLGPCRCTGFKRNGFLLQLLCLEMGCQTLDEWIEVPVEHGFQLVQGHSNAMIGHPVLREIIGAYLLTAIA